MAIDRRRAARPYLIQAFIGGVLALTGAVVARLYPIDRTGDEFTTDEWISLAGVALLAVAGIVAVRALGRAAHAAANDRLSEKTKGTPLSFFINAVGYLLLLIAIMESLDLGLEKLLLGGALTGVVIGIAAQQTLGNFFAGIVLLLVRPFAVGERIYLKGTVGEYEGTVTDMTLFYVHVQTERGPVMLPNTGVLASAVGPGAKAEKQKEREEQESPGEEPSA